LKRNEERGSWYLLTGLIIGILLGVIYTRLIQPVTYVDTVPASLDREAKNQYRVLIASAYLANGDLVRAQARLELLNDADVLAALTEQAQQTLAQNGSSADARALGLLAIALGQAVPGPGKAVTQALPNATSTRPLSTPVNLSEGGGATSDALTTAQTINEPPATFQTTSIQTEPRTAISPGEFVLLSKSEVCDQSYPEPIIQISVSDQSGQPIQGVLVIIRWVGGEDRFFTGLKPEKGPGYANYMINPDMTYSLQLGENGAQLGNLKGVVCQNSRGDPFWGAISLVYSQP